MQLITEVQADSQKILIVDAHAGRVTNLLKTTLTTLGADVYFSSRIPQDIRRFDLVFFINVEARSTLFQKIAPQRFNLLIVENDGAVKKLYELITTRALQNVKLIHLGRYAGREEIEKVLWFVLSKGSGRYLDLTSATGPSVKKRRLDNRVLTTLTPRSLIIFFLFVILITHLVLLPLQFAAFYLTVPPAKPLAKTVQGASQLVYRATRTAYSFFSSALLPDRMSDINIRLTRIPATSARIKSTSVLVQLFGEKAKLLPQDTKIIAEGLRSLERDLHILETDVTAVSDKLPDFPPNMTHYKKEFEKAKERAHLARTLTKAAREYLTHSLFIPPGLLVKLRQAVSSL